jgi:Icc protein
MKPIKIQDGERRILEPTDWSSAKTLDIAFFSDIHIPSDERRTEDRQIREKFLYVLGDALRVKCDLIVISGDLGQHQGCVHSYQWIHRVLSEQAIPYLIIPGNHDQAELLEKVFPAFTLQGGKLFYYIKLGDWRFAFLDSSPDRVSIEQVEWFENLIAKAQKDESWALVMHHPPVLCNCLYMDTHFPLVDSAPLLDVIMRHSQIKHVFCGHYHIGKELDISDTTKLHLTPSSWFQIDENNPEFSVSDERIGYRLITLDGVNLYTSTKMLSWE